MRAFILRHDACFDVFNDAIARANARAVVDMHCDGRPTIWSTVVVVFMRDFLACRKHITKRGRCANEWAKVEDVDLGIPSRALSSKLEDNLLKTIAKQSRRVHTTLKCNQYFAHHRAAVGIFDIKAGCLVAMQFL